MKISIIGGAGKIGSHIAFTLLLSDLKIDEIVLNDISDSVKGEAMDLQQAACGLKKNIKITDTKDLKICENSDIVVFVAGLSLSVAKTLDRYELSEKNFDILKSIFNKLHDNGKTIYMMISNHVDVLTYFLTKKINSRQRVIGISTLTDTMRMSTILKGRSLPLADVSAYITKLEMQTSDWEQEKHYDYLIGEHAGFMVPIAERRTESPSLTNYSSHYYKVTDNSDNNMKINMSRALKIVEEVKKLGLDIIKSKGGTWFATSVCVVNVIQSIINDEKKQFPISVLLDGEYGLHDVCLSVPCIIGKAGIEKIKEIELSSEQKLILKKAANSVQAGINFVKK